MHFEPDLCSLGQGKQMRPDSEAKHLARRKDQRIAGKFHAHLVAGGAGHQYAIPLPVQIFIDEFFHYVGQRYFDRQRPIGRIGGGQLDRASGRKRRIGENIETVVRPRTALANNQSLLAALAAWFQIHRGGFVGLDAQRLWFGKTAFAKRDDPLPLPFAPAAPSNAQTKFFGQEIKRHEGEKCQKGRPGAVFPPTSRHVPGGCKGKYSQFFRTSLSDHRSLLAFF